MGLPTWVWVSLACLAGILVVAGLMYAFVWRKKGRLPRSSVQDETSALVELDDLVLNDDSEGSSNSRAYELVTGFLNDRRDSPTSEESAAWRRLLNEPFSRDWAKARFAELTPDTQNAIRG